LSACGARQITKEWGELNPNWHLEAFGAFYTPFWAAYGLSLAHTVKALRTKSETQSGSGSMPSVYYLI
jgi:L-aminopeptidase/D-esterase-like protein